MEAILFDFGGTIDANGIACKDGFFSIYQKNGINIGREKFDRAFYDADDNLPLKHNLKGLTYERTFALQVSDVFENLGIKDAEKERAVLADFLAQTRANFKQNIPVFAELREKYKLGIVSNFFGNLADQLKSEGLLEFFGVVADSGALGFGKPDRRIFEYALNALGASAENSFMVGDSVSRDIAGADNLGMTCVLLWGDRFAETRPPLDCAKKLIVLKKLTELPQALKEWQ